LLQKSSGQPTIDADDVVATDGEEFLLEDENANALADIIGSMPLDTNGYVGMANESAAKIELGTLSQTRPLKRVNYWVSLIKDF
jgi:hypothetical protein